MLFIASACTPRCKRRVRDTIDEARQRRGRRLWNGQEGSRTCPKEAVTPDRDTKFRARKSNRRATNPAQPHNPPPLIFTLHYDPALYDTPSLAFTFAMSVVGIDFGALHSKVRTALGPLCAAQVTDVPPLDSRLVSPDTAVSISSSTRFRTVPPRTFPHARRAANRRV